MVDDHDQWIGYSGFQMNVQQTFQLAEALGRESLSTLESLLDISLLTHLQTAIYCNRSAAHSIEIRSK